MLADLPPNSIISFLTFSEEYSIILLPTSLLPVNEIISTLLSEHNACPSFSPLPTIILTTPLGRPASLIICANSSTVRGVRLEGLSTTVFPAASAWANFQEAINKG